MNDMRHRSQIPALQYFTMLNEIECSGQRIQKILAKKRKEKKTLRLMTAHFAGFIHGTSNNEGAIPVKLNIAYFSHVTNQRVDPSE